jgi:hypothetical protein
VSQTEQALVALVAGLLASGHYTERKDWSEEEGGGSSPKLLDYDAGPLWREGGHNRRFPRIVVDDAESLLDDIIKLSRERERMRQ